MRCCRATSPLQFGAHDLGCHSWVAEGGGARGDKSGRGIPEVKEEKQEDEPGAVRRRYWHSGDRSGPGTEVEEETEVELRLPRGTDPGPDEIPKDVPIIMGAAGAEQICAIRDKHADSDPEWGRTISVLTRDTVYTVLGAWQSAAEGQNAAGNRPVRGNAVHANPVTQ